MRTRPKINIFLMVFLAVLLIKVGYAQDRGSGTIEGFITDAKTGEPLIGVNAVILGTYLGTSSDFNGRYIIRNINPSEYTLELSYIGYKVIQKTGVKITAGEKVIINFELEQTALAFGQEIVVIGEKPLLQLNETGTVRSVNKEEIYNKPIENIQDIISEQVGVTQQDNEIHIRGSRSYEVQYLLDDISVQDPLSGTGFGLNISASAVEEVEVITGGFRAEYGQATSGIVNVKTKSGEDTYQGFISLKSDNLGLFRSRPWSFNTDIFEFNLGGREPLTSFLLPGSD
ncbi:MAG: carboxypeptidase-like regulatory domain-containing protein [bacterium]